MHYFIASVKHFFYMTFKCCKSFTGFDTFSVKKLRFKNFYFSADESPSIRSAGKNFAMSSSSAASSSSKVVSKTGNGNAAILPTVAAAGKSYTAQSQSAYSETRSYTSSAAKTGNFARATSPSKQKIQEKSLALNKGSTSPKLPSYRGTAEKCKCEGETVRHFNAGKLAIFELR